MPRDRRLLVGLALLLLAQELVAQTTWPRSRPRLEAHPIDEPIVVDGDLDDPAWGDAEVGTDFVQREPLDGPPATERTEISVAYTADTLYIAVRAFDTRPESLIAREMARDSRLARDDSVAVLLDTFHDRRNAYYFATNPNGARTDALITDEGRDRNFQWDGVWTVGARSTDHGWCAEIAIPFSTLRFNPGLGTWGLNVRRMIRRKNEEVFWSPIPREANVFRVSMAGELSGLRAVKPSRQVDIKPFLVGTVSETPNTPEDQTSEDTEVGLDVKWGITRNLALDLTYNTDFAEVEVDDLRINLTRFPLFFPEKREFFLENAGIFEFGSRSSASGFDPTFLKVFHSRQIGIEEGEEVPIDWGARLTGRVGEWNIGVLGITTDETGIEEEELIVPKTAFGVLRVKRNLGQRSSLGMIFTSRDEDGPAYNRVYGLDADLKPTTKLSFNAFWAQSDDPFLGGDDWAAGAGAFWGGKDLQANLDYLDIRENFTPEVGFVLRQGIKRYNSDVRYEPRPEGIRGIRALLFDFEGNYVSRTDGTLESRNLEFTVFGVRTTGDDRIGLRVWSDAERLFEPFEIQPDIFIAPGRYDVERWGGFVRTNEARRVSFRLFGSTGEFFDGDRLSSSMTLNVRASRFFRSETSWRYNDVDLPEGAFTTNLYSQRFNVSFTPELLLNAFLQYNDNDEIVAANIRFNWIYKPGADLFVVYKHNWDAPSLGDLTTDRREFIVKFTYLFQR